MSHIPNSAMPHARKVSETKDSGSVWETRRRSAMDFARGNRVGVLAVGAALIAGATLPFLVGRRS